MQNEQEVKDIVREKYGDIARKTSSGNCCGSSNKIAGYTIMKDEYTGLGGYTSDADLGLGCGLPTEFANIQPGNVVVDLGSGAGNDVFVARALAGDSGKVIGIDMTEEMIAKARRNNDKLGYNNVEFYLGEIEAMPLENQSADVVISNCVLNLVPNKQKAFAEIFRILKTGGHFCVSDIVINGELSASLKNSAAMYAGCVAGAVQQDEYLEIINAAGFKNVVIKKIKVIDLPDEVLLQYLSKEEIISFREMEIGIFSITVVAEKQEKGRSGN